MNDTCFYLVTSGSGVNLAHRFLRDNGGVPDTPALSLGAPYEPWRYSGTVLLSAAEDDPATPAALFGLDVGASDFAMKALGTFGGSYHGGESVLSQAIALDGSAVTGLASGQSFNEAVISLSSQVAWTAENVLSRSYGLTVRDDGRMTETQSITSALAAENLFIGMLIGSGQNVSLGFLERGDDLLAFPILQGTTYLGSEARVRLADPDTGLWSRSSSDAASHASFRRSYIIRSTEPGRSKLYHEFVTGTVGSIGPITREIGFGQGIGAVPTFSSILVNGNFDEGLSGWVATHLPTNSSVIGGQLQLVRHATNDVRINQPASCVPGGLYLLAARLAEGGTAPASASALCVGVQSNGSTTGAVATYAFSAPGYLGCLFTASQATHYVAAILRPGTAGETALWDDFVLYRIA
ncbi:hypothetical protein IC608_15040 [Devosia sp. PTR5]|uniref:Uncharacterized protein n=1 Tax=Devosia oryzisoli TaxID=2774138 RepID=A0A927FXL5_9HYPH|nr:hypothetical protein [Devosia oryzisoli]MBD8066788.1 hypothetical protein [Devosia oryzisoli]